MPKLDENLERRIDTEDSIDFDGFSDYPWPFEQLKAAGIEIVSLNENIAGRDRIKTFYKTKDGALYAVSNAPTIPLGFTDYNHPIDRAIEKYLQIYPHADPEQLNIALSHYQKLQRKFIKWHEAYSKRETAYIIIDNEFHPRDFPHPALAKHKAYKPIQLKNEEFQK